MGARIIISNGIAEGDIFRGAFSKIVELANWVVDNAARCRCERKGPIVTGVIGNSGNLEHIALIHITVIGQQQAIGRLENLLLGNHNSIVGAHRSIIATGNGDRGLAAIGSAEFVGNGVIKRFGGGLPLG